MVIIFQLFFIQYTYAFNLFSLGRLKNSFFRRPNFLISNIDISEAQNYSQVRSEDLKSQTKVITGSGTALTIAPGYTFTLSSPPAFVIQYRIYDLKQAVARITYLFNL